MIKNKIFVLIVIITSFSFLQMDCNDDEPCLTCSTPTDTTSHNFVFEIDTLGDGNGSSLYDIAIISDTLAYAVGEIHTSETGKFDSLGNWVNPYNVAKWDGMKWELLRAYFKYNGQDTWSPIHSIFAFNSDDIWFGAGIHWNGQVFETKPLTINFPSQVNKMWGDAKGLYAVGSDGLIAHRNVNGVWQKIESGTALPIQDIYGATNTVTGETEIYAVASNNSINQGKKVLRINGLTVSTVPDSGLPWSLRGIWFVPGKSYFVAGDGLYNISTIGSSWSRVNNLPPYYKTSIHGNHENDLFVAGAFMFLMHYNGKSWEQYLEPANGGFARVSIKNNFVVAVGTANNRGIVARGYRNQ